jgi:hypothetical protein
MARTTDLHGHDDVPVPGRGDSRSGTTKGRVRRRVLICSLASFGLIATLFLPVAAFRAQAAVPGDQVGVAIPGPVTGMTTTPSVFPGFSTSTHDYALYCKSGVNAITFTLTLGDGTQSTAQVNLGENQAAVLQASNGPFWVRCLPHDFPVLKAQVLNATDFANAAPGWYLTGNASVSASSSTYAMILDKNGTPVWYQKAPGGAVNVEALPGDKIAWMALNGPGVGADPSVGYRAYDLDDQTTQTIKAPVLPTDPHELLPMPNGDYLMIGSPLRQMTVTYQNTTYHAIVDCVVQEVNSQGSLVWSWRASDHVSPASSVLALPATINGQTALDVYHCNSVDADPATGQVLLSMRHTSSVYLIERVNPNGGLVQNGPLLWKLEGCGNSATDPDHETVLALQQDPEGCFAGQHDARFLPNGNVTIYDDHTAQQGTGARGVEYSVDVPSASATFVAQFSDGRGNASATGSFRMYDNGADNLVGWGFSPGSGFTEFGPYDAATGGATPFFSVTFPNGELDYRAVKVPLNALDINALRASAGLPRPTFPTVGYQTLGGHLTSNPGVAAWSSNRLDAFARGTDGQLWHRWWTGTQWSAWEPLGGQLFPGTGPAVASWAPGRLDVFVEGTDRQLWHRAYDSLGWHPWEALGGVLASGPAASSWGPGRLDIVVEGTNQAVWHKWYAGAWSGWQSLGGQATSNPALTSWAPGRVDAFVRGTDNQLYHAWYAGGVWRGWEALGGGLTTGPAATSPGPGLIDVAAVGTGNVPERLPYNGGWQIWQPLGGATSQSPSVAPFRGGEDVFVTGTDGGLWFGAVATAGSPQPAAVAPGDRPASINASRL